MEKTNEWFIKAPWGKIAVVSWGDPSGYPVLMVHGRADSSATFTPLMQYLPDGYRYVAIDLPGHGRSDPFPTGVTLMIFHFVVSIEETVKHLGWEQFIYIAHSMGATLGTYYSICHPNCIKKMIFIDPALSYQRDNTVDYPSYFKNYIEEYYENYAKYNVDDRLYTKQSALNAVMKARGLSERQAEVVLSRNLNAVGSDQYRLSWDRRLSRPAPMMLTNDFKLEIISKNLPPTLVLTAKDNKKFISENARDAVQRLFDKLQEVTDNFSVAIVDGGHDVHFTNPENVAVHICKFLNGNFTMHSKL